MLPSDRINEYVKVVCSQIRWKKAHYRVCEEMTNHMVDSRASYMAQGLDEKSATERAITEIGDATDIGTQLDRIHRPKPQWGMCAVTAVLLVLGIFISLFVFRGEDRIGSMAVRLFCTGIGIAGMVAAYFADFTIIGKYPKIVYFGVVSLSMALLVFSTLNGKAYYVRHIVLLFPLAFSAIIFATRNKGYIGILLCELAFVVPSFVVLCAPSGISGFLHVTAVGAALLGIAILKKWFGTKRLYGCLLLLAPVVLLTVIFFLRMTPYRWDRLATAWNPSVDPKGAGYRGAMVRELLSGAIFFGRGEMPGKDIVELMDTQPFFYTDLLLTSLISLFGWIAFAVLASVFLVFIAKGFRSCIKQKSSLGLFVSMAVMMTFCVQVISYVMYNLGFLFAAPISLPLVSYDNVATIINLVLIGFMLSVFRTGDVVTDGVNPKITKSNRFISWNDGRLTINFRAH